MKSITGLVFFLACSLCLSARESAPGRIEMGDASLEPLILRDSVLIADQLEYGFILDEVKAGTAFMLPDYSQGIAEGVEVVSPWKLDTLKVLKGKKKSPELMRLKGSVRIVSFDEGEYSLPDISVIRREPEGRTDTLVFKAKELSVRTMPVDTTGYRMHDIKGQIKYPVEFREVLPYLAGGLLLAAVILLAVFLTRKYFRNRAQGNVRREPAHIVALRKLDKFRGDSFWAPEKQKLFYSGVTDALREYIVARYGVQAMEMTTKEIFEDLKGTDIPEGLYSELKELFERSDYVKFAKYVADSQENASALPLAVRFVTTTYQEQIETEASKEEGGSVKVKEEE